MKPGRGKKYIKKPKDELPKSEEYFKQSQSHPPQDHQFLPTEKGKKLSNLFLEEENEAEKRCPSPINMQHQRSSSSIAFIHSSLAHPLLSNLTDQSDTIINATFLLATCQLSRLQPFKGYYEGASQRSWKDRKQLYLTQLPTRYLNSVS
ncbi:hypothetical protein STEG23_025151, partial [Scotinomys teguina]